MNGDLAKGPADAGPAFLRARSWLDRLDRVSRWAVIAAMAAMTLLVVSQVVFRYAFSQSLDWSEEMARLTFVWAMFLALPHGIRHGVHVGIDALVVCFSRRVQHGLYRLSAVLGGVLMAVVLWYGIEVTIYTWPELMPTLPVTAAVYYIAILVAAGHSLLHLILLAWGGPHSWGGPDDPETFAAETPA